MCKRSLSSCKSIGEKVRWARDSSKMSQEELAAASGVLQSSISRIENSVAVDPKFSTIVALCRATNCQLEDFA